jgi:hypothetical protein
MKERNNKNKRAHGDQKGNKLKLWEWLSVQTPTSIRSVGLKMNRLDGRRQRVTTMGSFLCSCTYNPRHGQCVPFEGSYKVSGCFCTCPKHAGCFLDVSVRVQSMQDAFWMFLYVSEACKMLDFLSELHYPSCKMVSQPPVLDMHIRAVSWECMCLLVPHLQADKQTSPLLWKHKRHKKRHQKGSIKYQSYIEHGIGYVVLHNYWMKGIFGLDSKSQHLQTVKPDMSLNRIQYWKFNEIHKTLNPFHDINDHPPSQISTTFTLCCLIMLIKIRINLRSLRKQS